MTDLDLLRTRLQDLITWWPHLEDHLATLAGITGHGIDLAGIHTVGTSPVETAVLQTIPAQTLIEELEDLASEWTWRGENLDGPALQFLHARLPWAATRYPLHDATQLIIRAHATVARLTGHAPRPTGRTCPACGENQLMLLDNGLLRCDTCQLDRHPDEIQALTTWRITTSTETAPLPIVAKHLGIKPTRIRKWIQRGLLTREPDGTINIRHTRTLKERHGT